MPLPIDFEEKIKLPAQVNGGYPYSIKAEDLMDNFKYCVIETDSSATDEVQLTIAPAADGTRRISATVNLPETESFPGGENIDLLIDQVFINISSSSITRTAPTDAACWRNGLYVGTFAIGAVPSHTGTKNIRTSTFITGAS
jgi:hypothetical protein